MAEEDTETKVKNVYTISDRVTPISDKNVAFEDALEMTGVGRYNYTLFIISNIVLLTMAMEIFGTSYIVTSSACDLELTTEIKGIVAAMPMLGVVVSAHLWGWLADTRGRRTVLLTSMWGSFVFGFISSFSVDWVMLATTKFIAAFFASASNAVMYAMFGECTPSSVRNKYLLLISSGLMFAQGFMTFTAYPVLSSSFDFEIFSFLHYKPWRLLQQMYAAWSLASALLIMFLVKESPKFYASQGEEHYSIRVMAEIYSSNTGRRCSDYPVKSLNFQEASVFSKDRSFLVSMWEQTVPLFKPPLLSKTLIITYIVIVVYAISPSFLMWNPTITNSYSRTLSSGNTHTSFCTMLHRLPLRTTGNSTGEVPACNDKVENLTFITVLAFSFLLAVLNTLNSYIIKYVGKKALVIAVHIIGGVSGIVIPLIPNVTVGLLMYFMFQINLLAMGLTTVFTVEVYPTYLRAMAVCLTMMVGRGSAILSITYVGVLMEQYCDIAFYVFGAIVLSGALVGLLLPSDIKEKKSKVAVNNK